jgi:hypothetical protein
MLRLRICQTLAVKIRTGLPQRPLPASDECHEPDRSPAIDDRLKPSTRKFPATILEINFCKAVVTNDWPAVLFAETPVFTFDAVETGRKTTLAFFHRVHLAKHRNLRVETGQCIPA